MQYSYYVFLRRPPSTIRNWGMFLKAQGQHSRIYVPETEIHPFITFVHNRYDTHRRGVLLTDMKSSSAVGR